VIRQAIAKSDTYKPLFRTCSRYRYIEPQLQALTGAEHQTTFEELRSHSTILDEFGFQATFDSFIDQRRISKSLGEDNPFPICTAGKPAAGRSMLGIHLMFPAHRWSRAAISRETSLALLPSSAVPLTGNTSFQWISPAIRPAAFRLASRNGIGKTRSGVGAASRKGVSSFRSVAIKRTKFQKFSRYRQFKPGLYYVPFEKLSNNTNEFTPRGGKNSQAFTPGQLINPLES